MPEQEHTAVQSETPENKVSGKTEDLAETSVEMPRIQAPGFQGEGH